MPLAHARTLVFGPTGNVGSIVARTAHAHKAQVFLAMRDINKPIPGLTPSDESSGGFKRVYADLTEPSSIRAAVTETKATSAFIYLAHRSSDHMKSTIEAFKEAGIEFLVFLSSFTIRGKLEDIPTTTGIPYIHARVEMNLEAIYGRDNFVALRVGAFATNTLRWRHGISEGEVNLQSPDTEYDFITPTDMGSVGGNILVNGMQDGQDTVYLYGPKLTRQRDALAIVGSKLGLDLTFVSADEQDHSALRSNPPSNRRRVIVKLGPEEEKSEWFLKAYTNHEEGTANVMRYTGREAESFEHWVEGNTQRYSMM